MINSQFIGVKLAAAVLASEIVAEIDVVPYFIRYLVPTDSTLPNKSVHSLVLHSHPGS